MAPDALEEAAPGTTRENKARARRPSTRSADSYYHLSPQSLRNLTAATKLTGKQLLARVLAS